MINPYNLVAQALNCSKESLSANSGLNRHPDWDSFGHLNVILAIEEAYQIKINDEQVMRFSEMKEIVTLFEEIRESRTEK